MGLLKRIIKKILIKLHLMKPAQPVAVKKEKPDFNITTRNMPEYILNAGEFCEGLNDSENPKIAIQVHAFFMEVMNDVVDVLNTIPYPYDCYISTDTQEKKEQIVELLEKQCKAHYLQVDVMDNRGRDVGPFLQQLSPVISKYKYMAHFHTKRSKHTDFGDDWRLFMLRNLFGGKNCVSAILEMFEKDEKLGLVVPEVYPIVRELMAWDNTKDDVKNLLGSMGFNVELPDVPMCPAGDFFWARVDAVKVLFEQGITQKDFQEEAGQLNYTLAHVIERIWCYLVEAQGYDYKVCINGVSEELKKPEVKRALLYVCSSEIQDIDYDNIKRLVSCFEYAIVGVKSAEAKEELLRHLDCEVVSMVGERSPFLWTQLLLHKEEELKAFDEIALADNSVIGPLFDLKGIMDEMSVKNTRAWSALNAKVTEGGFACFNTKNYSNASIREMLKDNIKLSSIYVNESKYIDEWLFVNDNVTELTFDHVILHSPFVTKESLKNMKDNEKVLFEKFFAAIN